VRPAVVKSGEEIKSNLADGLLPLPHLLVNLRFFIPELDQGLAVGGLLLVDAEVGEGGRGYR
jgi:hypothetical protein